MKGTRGKKPRQDTADSEPTKKARGAASSGGTTRWQQTGGLLYCNLGSTPSAKVVGFDMDSTLITTKSGKTFAVNKDDWRILYPEIKTVLKRHLDDGFQFVIFTNQKGVQVGKTTVAEIQAKIEAVVEELGVPMAALAAIGDDEYRKPCPGMWTFYSTQINPQATISQSIYVGDAAGRPARGSRKKDFNDTDLKFARNLEIDFKTPEQFFLGEREEIPEPEFNPKNIKKTGAVVKGLPPGADIASSSQEVIIFVGSPASGKSTFWKNHLSSYVRVNNDTLKSQEKCVKVMREALQSGKSCVIDNTNPTADVRARYTTVAKEFNVPMRCFVFRLPKEVAFHLDTLREVNTNRTHLSKRVGSMPIHTFYKNFQEPTTKEGFSEIKDVELVGGPFENSDDERLFYSYVHS